MTESEGMRLTVVRTDRRSKRLFYNPAVRARRVDTSAEPILVCCCRGDVGAKLVEGVYICNNCGRPCAQTC